MEENHEGMKKCPFCAEWIQEEAIKCRYCGSDVTKRPGAKAGRIVRDIEVDGELAFSRNEKVEIEKSAKDPDTSQSKLIAFSKKINRQIELSSEDVVLASKTHPRRKIEQVKTVQVNTEPGKPKCPSCGSTRIERFSKAWKVTKIASVGVFGLGNVHKIFKCKDCGYKW